METTKQGLYFKTGIDNSGLQSDSEKAKKILRDVSSTAQKEGAAIDKTFKNIGKTIAAVFTVQKLIEFTRHLVSVRSEIQGLEVSFRTLLGSKEKADALLSSLRQFAVNTPMMLKDLASGAQTLLAFNVAAEDIMPTLKSIGDISMGDAQKFQSLTLAFAQMSSTGKLMGQDLLQMINAGFNPLTEIAAKTGKSIAQLKDEMSAGSISAEMVADAFKSATAEGGKFYGMLEAQSKTLKGAISNMQGAFDDMLNSLGEVLEGPISGMVDGLTTLIKNYKDVALVVAEAAAVFGVYKTAVIAVNVAHTVAAEKLAGYTLAQQLSYKWALLQEKAQALLNKTMLSNPYVAVATALAALAAGVVYLVTRENEMEAAQSRLNDAVKEADKAWYAEERQLDAMFGKLKAAKEGTQAYEKAKQDILNQYGEYLNGLNKEIATLKDVEGAYKAVASAAREAARARAMQTYLESENSNYANTMGDIRERAHELFVNKFGSKKGEEHFNKFLPALEGKGQVTPEMSKILDTFTRADFKAGDPSAMVGYAIGDLLFGGKHSGLAGVVENDMRTLLMKSNEAREALNYAMKQAQVRYGGDEGTSPESKEVVKNKKYYEDLVKEKQAQYDALQKTELNTKKAKDLAKEIKEAQAAIDAYDLKGNKGGGSGANTEANNRQKRFELQQLLSEEQVRQAKETAAAVKKAEIAGIVDNGERTRAEQKEQHRLNLEAIDDREADMKKRLYEYNKQVWEANNKNKKKKYSDTEEGKGGWAAVELSPNQQAMLDAQRLEENRNYQRLVQDRFAAELSAMREYLKEYGTLEQQKFAITQEYEDKISKAATEGERLQLRQQMKSSLTQLGVSSLKERIDWANVMSDFGGIFRSQLSGQYERLQKLTGTDEFKSRSYEDQKQIFTILDQMREKIGGFANLNFNSLGEELNKLTRLEAEASDAKEHERLAINGVQIAQDRLKKALEEGNDEEIKRAKVVLKSAEDYALSMGNATKKAEAAVKEQQDIISDSAKNLRAGINAVVGALRDFQSDSVAGIWEGFKKLQDTFGKEGNNLSEMAAESLGKAIGGPVGDALMGPLGGEILEGFFSVLDILSDGIENLISNLVDTVMNAVDGLLKTALDPTSIAFAAGTSLADGLRSIGNTLTFGGLDKALGLGSYAGNAKETLEAMARLDNRAELLTTSLDGLRDEISRSHGTEAIQATAEAERLQRELEQNRLQNAQLQAGYSGHHHSWNYYWGGFTQDEIAELSRRTGTQWDGNLWSLTPDQMKVLRDMPDTWQRIQETGKGGYGDRLTAELDEYIAQAGKLKEITDALNESLTTTTVENVFDDFLNSLYDLSDGAEDVFENIGDDWQKMVNKMAVNNLVGNAFKEKLEEWYEQLAQVNKDRTSGIINDTEFKDRLAALKEDYVSMVEEAQSSLENLRELGVIAETEEARREGTSKGIAQASQDSVDELNGRATAIQGHTYSIAENTKLLVATSDAILRSVLNIEGNTDGLTRKVDNLYDQVKYMRNDINDMATRGITIKR